MTFCSEEEASFTLSLIFCQDLVFISVAPFFYLGAINSHVGNIMFRKIVDEQRPFYCAASKTDKPLVALRVVYIVRNLDPPGRFLAPMKESERNLVKGNGVLWYDVGNKKARAKASQCLRERKLGDASYHNYADDDCVDDERMCPSSNTSSIRSCESPNKVGVYKAEMIPESPIRTGDENNLFHGIMRNRIEDPILFDYSPMSTAYLKHNLIETRATSTPALLTYHDQILPTVSRGDETGWNIVQDSTLIDPLHFFELDCRANNSTWNKHWLHQEEMIPQTMQPHESGDVDPLLMFPSEAGFKRGNSSLVPSFHSTDSCDLDVSHNTFSVTVAPRKNEKQGNTFPSLVRSFSIKSDRLESMSDLTDTSITDDFFVSP